MGFWDTTKEDPALEARISACAQVDAISYRAHAVLESWRYLGGVDIRDFTIEDHDLLFDYQNDIFALQESCIHVTADLRNAWRGDSRGWVGPMQQGLYLARVLYRLLEESSNGMGHLVVEIHRAIKEGNRQRGLERETKIWALELATIKEEEADCPLINEEDFDGKLVITGPRDE